MLNAFQVDLTKAIVEKGSLEDVRKLVIGKYDIDKPLLPTIDLPVIPPSKRTTIPQICGPTPLVLAILNERTEICEYLIKDKNADLNVPVGGLFPIHYACITGINEILLQILDTPVGKTQVNMVNHFRYTPLHIAAANGHLRLVLTLLKHGASVQNKQQPDSGNSVLHVAMRGNDTTIIEALLSKGASLEWTNILKETPKDTAKAFNNTAMVDFLDSIEHQQIIPRSFDELCRLYLDNEIGVGETELVRQLSDRVQELTARLNQIQGI